MGPDGEASRPLEVTRLLEAARQGDAEAGEAVLPLLYEELRAIARARMRGQAPGHTLAPTGLVHEAWLRLAGAERPWESRRHFFCVAARAMRSVLVDHARAKGAAKRGAGREREPLSAALAWYASRSIDVEALDRAIEDLGRQDPRKRQVVELRFFAGLTNPQVAEVLDLSLATVERAWRLARAWLGRALGPEAPAPPAPDAEPAP